MKNKALNFLKKTASVMLMTVMLVGVSAVSVQAGEPKDESGANLIVYEKYDYTEFENKYKTNTVAPEPCDATVAKCSQGYVFGGWFTLKDANTKTYYPVTKKADVQSGDVYAKFVPAYVMGVKCQNVAGTKDTDGTATMKFVSAMDSSNYKSYNFKVSAVRVNDDGTFIKSEDITNQLDVVSKVDDYTYKVYKKFLVYESAEDQKADEYAPSALFGPEAQYFTTWGIGNIQNASFDKIICIEPSWTTLDGTVVQGLAKYAHVEDGFVHIIDGVNYRYVNVPINLRQMQKFSKDDGVAAGVMSVGYTSDELIFDSVESGRFFEEMAWAPKTKSVKLVGNTLTITNKNQNDVYANIRFRVQEDSASAVLKGFDFTISDVDFSDSAETQYNATTYPVWNIKY